MKQHTFKLSDSGKEFPARFGGLEVTYNYPENMEEVRRLVPEDQDADACIYGKVMNQGIHLDIQKSIKDALGETDSDGNYIHAEGREGALKLEDVPALALKISDEYRLPVPGVKRGEGKAAKAAQAVKRAEQAEKKLDVVKEAIAAQFKNLPKNARGAFATDLVQRGVFTQEEIDALNAA